MANYRQYNVDLLITLDSEDWPQGITADGIENFLSALVTGSETHIAVEAVNSVEDVTFS